MAGSLVLGQNQECYGACFSPSQSLDGTLAAVRVWNTVRTAVSSLPTVQHILPPFRLACLSPSGESPPSHYGTWPV